MLDHGASRVAKNIQDCIEDELSRAGLLFRVFSRIKTSQSLSTKKNREEGKYGDGKKIQDYFGYRIVLYFQDDIDIASELIKKKYVYDKESSTIDTPSKDSFSATRFNLIFNLPEDDLDQIQILANDNIVDKTFEVQLRTVLSEGWHEVEHDLRYKCKQDWQGHDDLNRALNGVFATLETSEWSMLKLFEELSYRHYKANEWPQMLRTKFRLRTGNNLSEDLTQLFDSDNELGKELFRINRNKFVRRMSLSKIELPINLDNIVFLCNSYYIDSKEIDSLMPAPVKDAIQGASNIRN